MKRGPGDAAGRRWPRSRSRRARPASPASATSRTATRDVPGIVGAHDHLWRGGDHRFEIDLRRGQRERREDVATAAHRDGFRDEMVAADGVERTVPYLVEHGQRRRERWSRFSPARRARRASAARFAGVGVPASAPSFSMSAAMPAIVRGCEKNTGIFSARRAASCAGAVHGHVTIRSGCSDTIRSRSRAIASPRGESRWPPPENRSMRHHPHHSRPCTRRKQHFRRMRRQAHDALAGRASTSAYRRRRSRARP